MPAPPGGRQIPAISTVFIQDPGGFFSATPDINTLVFKLRHGAAPFTIFYTQMVSTGEELGSVREAFLNRVMLGLLIMP